MSEKIKCADCGFLAMQHFETRQLMEAESNLRENGEIRPAPDWKTHTNLLIYDPHPICFARRLNFRAASEMGSGANNENRAACIKRERECNGFTPWIQGFTPKEHQEMLLSEKALEIQRAEQAADREWRDSQAQREHNWRQEDLTRDRGWRNEDRSIAMSNLFVVAGTGIISVIVTLVASKLLPWLPWF